MMDQKSQAEGHFSFEKQKTFDISKKSLEKCYFEFYSGLAIDESG